METRNVIPLIESIVPAVPPPPLADQNLFHTHNADLIQVLLRTLVFGQLNISKMYLYHHNCFRAGGSHNSSRCNGTACFRRVSRRV